MRCAIAPILALMAIVFSASCGVFMQDSVRSHGTQCSDSYFWMGADAATAGVIIASMDSSSDNSSDALLPVAGLIGSAAIGYYKRKNCLAHRQGASPEQRRRDMMRAEAQAEAQDRNIAQLGQMMRERRQPRSEPTQQIRVAQASNAAAPRRAVHASRPSVDSSQNFSIEVERRPADHRLCGPTGNKTVCATDEYCIVNYAGTTRWYKGGLSETLEEDEYICKQR